jgi:membrane-associated phospholipid phosphatase
MLLHVSDARKRVPPPESRFSAKVILERFPGAMPQAAKNENAPLALKCRRSRSGQFTYRRYPGSRIKHRGRTGNFFDFRHQNIGRRWSSVHITAIPVFVLNASFSPQSGATLALVNPLAGADHQIAGWFHAHLSQTFVNILRVLSEPGSGEWIGIVLFLAAIFFVWKRAWPALVTIVVAVPGGMLLNELLKLAVHRHRPFLDGWFVDWSGYSFASGHTIGATLLYGQLLLFTLPLIKAKYWQRLMIFSAALLVMLVGFSRIALGAHYLSDVIGAIFLGVVWLIICALLLRPMRRRVVVAVAVSADEPRSATAATAEAAR